MPIVTWLGGIFTALAGWLGTYFAKRFAIVAAYVATVTGVLLGATVAFSVALQGLAVAMPGSIGPAIALLPANTPLCVSAIIAAQIAARLAEWQIHFAAAYSKGAE